MKRFGLILVGCLGAIACVLAVLRLDSSARSARDEAVFASGSNPPVFQSGSSEFAQTPDDRLAKAATVSGPAPSVSVSPTSYPLTGAVVSSEELRVEPSLVDTTHRVDHDAPLLTADAAAPSVHLIMSGGFLVQMGQNKKPQPDRAVQSPASTARRIPALSDAASGGITIPAVLAPDLSPLNLQPEQQAAIHELADAFIEKVGEPGVDLSGLYARRVRAAMSEADARYRLLYGDRAYVQLQLLASHQLAP